MKYRVYYHFKGAWRKHIEFNRKDDAIAAAGTVGDHLVVPVKVFKVVTTETETEIAHFKPEASK